jgi:hypothetical protein
MQPRGTVAAWLLTIARNVSIDMLATRRFDPIDPEDLLALEAKRPHQDRTEAQVVDAELSREPLARLPPGPAASVAPGRLLRGHGAGDQRTRRGAVGHGEAVLGGAKGTWGGQLPVDLSAVHELRFVGSDGRPTLAATFDTTNPWD